MTPAQELRLGAAAARFLARYAEVGAATGLRHVGCYDSTNPDVALEDLEAALTVLERDPQACNTGLRLRRLWNRRVAAITKSVVGRPRTARGAGSRQVVVRLSEEEEQKIEYHARASGHSPAQILRDTYFNGHVSPAIMNKKETR